MPNQPIPGKRRLCSFHVGPLLVGLDVAHIQEVMMHSGHTRVPGAGAAVTGLINLRGQIATTIDLRTCFSVRPEPDAENIQVVVLFRGDPVGLLVDDVGDVLDVDERDFEPAPGNVDSAICRLLEGAYKLEDRLLLTVDVERAIVFGTGRPELFDLLERTAQ